MIPGHSFRLRADPESASHSERRFWDAVSAEGSKGKAHPVLRHDSGTQFPPRADPESASHSERQFRDALSASSQIAPNKRSRLAMELGPKAQHMQLVLSADGSSAWPSAPYPTRGDGRGCTGYPPWADLGAACRQTRGRRSVRQAPWGSLRSHRCPCHRMPQATARPSPRR